MDDLCTGHGVVLGRAAPSPRSIETRPCDCNDLPCWFGKSLFFCFFLLPNSGHGLFNFSVAVEKCVKKFFRLRFYALEIFTKLGARSFKF